MRCHWRFTRLALACSTAACAAQYTPPQRPAPKPFAIHTTFADAWPRTIAFVQEAKFPIDHLSPPEGLLQMRAWELNRIDSAQWLDCGVAKFGTLDSPKSDSLVGYLTITVTDMRDSVSVFVDLTAVANTTVLNANERRIVRHGCVSNGRFERDLLNRLRTPAHPPP